VADLHLPLEEGAFTNDQGTPAVMLLHGGFWKQAFDRSLMTPMAEALAQAGLIVWNVEYRRWSPEDEGVWQETISDTLRAWGHLEGLDGVDATRTAVIGHSAGGHLALVLSALSERTPTFCIAQAAVSDLVAADQAGLSDGGDATRRWIGQPSSSDAPPWNDLNPIHLSPQCPVIMAHGTHDLDVPASMSVACTEAYTSRHVDATMLQLQGDHYTIISPEHEGWKKIQDVALERFML
jgi:acetyl esterase/lipase